jgi:hypothetical protein
MLLFDDNVPEKVSSWRITGIGLVFRLFELAFAKKKERQIIF